MTLFARRALAAVTVLVPVWAAQAHDAGHSAGDGVHAGTSEVRMSVSGDVRTIEANGIPEHGAGRFPNAGNPHSIRVQRYRFRMPAAPRPTGKTTSLGMGLFGVALDGVPFDPGTAEFWRNDPSSGWNYDALSGALDLGMDIHHAHVQPNGAYHYHGIPTGLVERLHSGAGLVHVGYAADGFPVYAGAALESGYRLKSGTRPGGPGGAHDGSFVQDWEHVPGRGELDECNGRTGSTAEYPDGTYYYVLTETFPFVPRCFKGVPDPSFRKQGGPGGPGGMRPPPRDGRPPPGGRPPPPR